MKINNLIHWFVTFIVIGHCQSKNYANYVLFNLLPVERYQIEFLQNLEKMKYMNVMFWTKPSKMDDNIQVLVSPTDVLMFKERLKHFSVKSTVLSNNIQKLFDNQKMINYSKVNADSFSWMGYHNLEGIYQWMTDLAAKYVDKLKLKAIGMSAEGREILAIEFNNPTAKNTVIIEGGIHGNEWITTEFVIYLIYHIARADKSKDLKLQQVAKKYRWALIPVANPDGYVYSMKTDRLWRKNRRNLGHGVFGVDLNRNFNYNFCSHDASNKSQDINYCGPYAFSEPETQSISSYVRRHRENLKFYFSFHAYGQKIIVPYSDRIQHLENFSEMENYGKQAILQMHKLHHIKYGIGTIYDTYGYRSSGDSASWVKKTFNVKYALSFFLRDNGTYGHALPSSMILPTCKEMLTGLMEIMTVRHRHVARELFSSAVNTRTSYILTFLLTLFLLK